LGFPLELFAVAYFVINILLVCLIAFGSSRLFRTSLNILFGWRFLGIAIVPYLVFVELFLVRAICIYCTVMHVAIIADFLIISYLLFYKKRSPIGLIGTATSPGQAYGRAACSDRSVPAACESTISSPGSPVDHHRLPIACQRLFDATRNRNEVIAEIVLEIPDSEVEHGFHRIFRKRPSRSGM
jgi:hypothetical protein